MFEEGLWKLNRQLLEDEQRDLRLRNEWMCRSARQRLYPDRLLRWEKCCKRNVRYFSMSKSRERSQTASLHEEFYLACIYHTLRNHGQHRDTLGRLSSFKAKLIDSTKAQSVAVDTREDVLYLQERPTLFHLSQRQAWRTARLVTSMVDTSEPPRPKRTGNRDFCVFCQCS